MNKTVVVTSIYGRQQVAVANAFRRKGWTIRGTARKDNGHALATMFETGIEEGPALVEAFRGADVVAFSLIQDHRPGVLTGMAKAVADAATQAGVKRIVYNLAGAVDEVSDQLPATDIRIARATILNGPVPATILQPTVYMDNLMEPWSKPAIVIDGVFAYPAPDDAPISWLSHQSLADNIVAAAESAEAAGKEYRIGGPAAITGTDMAKLLGNHLRREVRYYRLPLETMAAGLNHAMGEPTGDRIVKLYARLDREPGFMDLGKSDVSPLGVTPESFGEFVARNSWSLPEAAPAQSA